MDGFVYQPTPLEEAYSQYLIRTVFPQTSDAAFRISGRNAVPFLSQSGLPRDLLRNIWSCVDPNTTGYLSDVQQFHTLLRLVALGQCQMIDANHLQQCCMETAHRTDLPLASFQGYPIPDAMTLLSSYSSSTTVQQHSIAADPFQNWNTTPEVTSTHPSPPLYSQPPSLMTAPTNSDEPSNVEEDDDEFGDFTTTPATVTVGAWDALDQLVTVADAPLPALPTAPSKSEPILEDEDDFGTFADAAAPPIEVAAAAKEVDPDFGTFTGAGVVEAAHGIMQGAMTDGNVVTDWNAPLSMGMGTTSMNALEPSTTPALHLVANDLGLPAATNQDVFSSAFTPNGTKIPQSDLSTNANGTVLGIADAPNAFDDPFSAFDAISSVADSTLPDRNPDTVTVPLNSAEMLPEAIEEESDGFGDFVTPIESSSQTNAEILKTSLAEERNDFGDFVGMPEDDEATNIDAIVESQQIDIFNGAATGTAESVDNPFPVAPAIENDWTALDALVETKDAPLPLLQPIEVSSTDVSSSFSLPVKPEESESEGFGDFVGTNDINANAHEAADATLAPDSSDLFVESSIPTTDALGDGWGALDALAGNHDTPLNALDGIIPSTPLTEDGAVPTEISETAPTLDTECDHGDGSMPVSPYIKESSTNHTAVAPDMPSLVSGWDALDALSLVSDTPLSITMESRAVSASVMINDIAEVANEDFSDGFGDFVSGPTTESLAESSDPSDFVFKDATDQLVTRRTENATEMLQAEDSGRDAFDALHQSSDAPLPPLLDVSKKSNVDVPGTLNSANEDLSDGFGDFVSGPSSEGEMVPSNSVPVEASGDALPSLLNGSKDTNAGMPDSVNTAIEDLSDGFGDFITGPSIEEVMTPTNPVPVDTASSTYGDSFGLQKEGEPGSLTKSALLDRGDSSYYSATAKSVSSDSQDFTNFEDAVMNGIDDENDVDTSIPDDAKNAIADDIQGVVSGNTGNEENDLFHAFDSVAAVNPSRAESILEGNSNLSNADNNDSEFDDFGDFLSVPAAVVEPSKFEAAFERVDGDDDFSDFETIERAVDHPVSDPYPVAAESDDAEFGDFGDFTNAGIALAESQRNDLVGHRELVKGWYIQSEEDWKWTKSQIIFKSSQLPDLLRLRANGSSVDFGSCFDANIGMNLPPSERQMQQILRCVQLMDLLSTSHAEIAATYWINVCSIVELELSNGLVLLHDAIKLSPKNKEYVKTSLQMFLRGLGEMVRVVRCIVATLADMLLLPPSTSLSEENLDSCWCTNALASRAMQIESFWDQILERSAALDLPHISQLESVVKIRSRSDSVTELCYFSLQPFPDPFNNNVPTQSVVTYGDHSYMACAANLLAHQTEFFSSGIST